MQSVSPVPNFLQFGSCARRILVLESADITWLGLCRLAEQSGMKDVSLMRIPTLDRLADMVNHYAPDMLLLTSVGRKTEILPLLQQLSDIVSRHPELHIVALLKQELPHLADLLRAFGVAKLFIHPPSVDELSAVLTAAAFPPHEERLRLLTPQERNVAKALLRGYSVSRIAQTFGKNVRTVSTQKQSVIHKLNMTNPGELQVLGGRLMSTDP